MVCIVTVSGSSTLTPTGLLIVAIAHGFAIYAAITISLHISGGHVNPAVTVNFLVRGHMTFIKAIVYIISQLSGAVLASLLLLYVTNIKVHVHTSLITYYVCGYNMYTMC